MSRLTSPFANIGTQSSLFSFNTDDLFNPYEQIDFDFHPIFSPNIPSENQGKKESSNIDERYSMPYDNEPSQEEALPPQLTTFDFHFSFLISEIKCFEIQIRIKVKTINHTT